MRFYVIIVAGGNGTRMNSALPKHRGPGAGRLEGGPDDGAHRGVLLRHRPAWNRRRGRAGPVLPACRRGVAPDDPRHAVHRQAVGVDRLGRPGPPAALAERLAALLPGLA